MTNTMKRAAATAIALSLGLGLAACGDTQHNRSLNSVKQPVVSRANYTLDLSTSATGLSVPEQARLAAWFETLDLGYGDRVAIDDPMASPAVREDVAAVASRFGILVSEAAPVTEGYVDPGNVRIVVSRSTAYVPGCPDFSDQYAHTLGNETSNNFGCAVNSNIAAMVADPEHLLKGAKGTGETVVMSSTKAIQTYREAAPTGSGGSAVNAVSSNSAGGN